MAYCRQNVILVGELESIGIELSSDLLLNDDAPG